MGIGPSEGLYHTEQRVTETFKHAGPRQCRKRDSIQRALCSLRGAVFRIRLILF
jgi:hypothetical protein